MRYLLFACVLICCSCSKKSGWQSLFNGKDLSNFEKLNGTATYTIEEDCIVGISEMNTPNTFLATKKKYGDFILEFEVLVDSSLNSGVQFRSISDQEILEGRVHGYQCEIESSSRKWAGGIYDEERRGWIYPLKDNPTGQEAFRVNEWNKYRIEAIGNEIRTWVNGIQCAHLRDNLTSEGIIGLQVHAIGEKSQVGKTVRWRNLKIITSSLEKERRPIEEYAELIDLTLKNQ